jgi:hypothetical protein
MKLRSQRLHDGGEAYIEERLYASGASPHL